MPGQKVFETKPGDKPWRLNRVEGDLSDASLALVNIHVEHRTIGKGGATKTVLSLNFGSGQTNCTPAQIAWVKQLYPDTVRIILSGYTDLAVVTDAVNRGSVFKFLTKPWEDDLLREQVRDAFRRYRPEKAQA